MRAGPGVRLFLLLVLLAAAPARADESPLIFVSDAKSRNFQIRDGVADGLFPAVLREALGALGRRIEFRVRPWARCSEETRAGAADGWFAIYRLPSREQSLLYSNVPIYQAQEHIYLRQGQSLDVAVWRDALKGKRVGIVNGSYHGAGFEAAAADHLFGEVETVNSDESLVAMLEAGRIDAAFSTTELMAQTAVVFGRPVGIVRTEPAVASMPTYLAFTRKKDYTALRDSFDRELLKMKEDGRYEALRKRYAATN